MTQRGRPRLPVQAVVLNLKLRLRPGVDDDLIAFFGQIPPRHRAGRGQGRDAFREPGHGRVCRLAC